MKHLLFLIFVSLSLPICAYTSVRWHNEAADTTLITEILKDVASRQFDNPSARTAYIASIFLGRPYVAHTLEGDEEVLTVNLDQLDCTTFVDVVLALSYTAGEQRQGWQDFLFNLERMRYRSGTLDGYSSRLHYICDWAIDNIYRGNLLDITPQLPHCSYIIRSIDFMTTHRDRYPALADSATFQRIKNIEDGYRNHRFPYIKTSQLNAKDLLASLRSGDVIAFVSNRKDLDVTHLGFVIRDDKTIRVLHASSSNGVVEISDCSLHDFLKRNRNWIGIRVFRLKN